MKTRKTIKKGSSDFKTIIEDNGYFVDKTMLIKEFFEDNSYTLLIPRPKRFGKTLNLSMIEHFFDIQKPESNKLFKGFEISGEFDFCKKHQNNYPVINISLKSVKEYTWEECLEKYKSIISKLYQIHDFLLESDKLKDAEKQIYAKILSKTANEVEYKESLESLCHYLKKHFDRKVIILVDEYDSPIISAFKYTPPPIKTFNEGDLTYYERVINFMQGFLGDAFKGNNDLKKGLLTGVMRVGKESIFSEWNNFEVYGITSKYYANRFGFTKAEVSELLTYFHLADNKNIIEKWYDGYKFGDVDNLYNPWSIVSYISNRKDGFKPYWVNTGDYSLIKSRIIEMGVKDKIQKLIEGEIIDKELKENFVFQDFEGDNELLWSLLVDNGYLTPVEKSKYGNFKLRIPNNEVKIVFKDIVMTWLNREVKIMRDLLINTAEDLINNRIHEFEKGFKQILGDTLSYFDIAQKYDKRTRESIIIPEQIFHVYTLGLLTILSDDYIIKSNRESKQGRYDILLIPHDKNNLGIVIEIKQTEKRQASENENQFKKRINRVIDTALDQIEKNEYYKELIIHKINPENIIKLAIVFAGKEPYINKCRE